MKKNIRNNHDRMLDINIGILIGWTRSVEAPEFINNIIEEIAKAINVEHIRRPIGQKVAVPTEENEIEEEQESPYDKFKRLMEENEALTASEAADELGLDITTIYGYRNRYKKEKGL